MDGPGESEGVAARTIEAKPSSKSATGTVGRTLRHSNFIGVYRAVVVCIPQLPQMEELMQNIIYDCNRIPVDTIFLHREDVKGTRNGAKTSTWLYADACIPRPRKNQ